MYTHGSSKDLQVIYLSMMFKKLGFVIQMLIEKKHSTMQIDFLCE